MSRLHSSRSGVITSPFPRQRIVQVRLLFLPQRLLPCEIKVMYRGVNYALHKEVMRGIGDQMYDDLSFMTDGEIGDCEKQITSLFQINLFLTSGRIGGSTFSGHEWGPEYSLFYGRPNAAPERIVHHTVQPVQPVPTPEPRRFIDRSDRQQGQQALVLIQADSSRGSGFIARVEGKPFIFTNQHVIQGATRMTFETLRGQKLKPLSLEVASSGDLVRLAVADAGLDVDVEYPEFSFDEPVFDDPVLVMGNSDGAGVVTSLEGKVLAVGPSEIEVDAEFVSGNSGSPLFNLAFDVIGVATYVKKANKEDWVKKDTRFSKVRRFAVRVTSRTSWKKVSPKSFAKQGGF